MRRVGSKNTKPEMLVRSLLHRAGLRFRLHATELPGKPDIILPRWQTVIFVHGCFWHRHKNCPEATLPATNQAYWVPKFTRTLLRDRKNRMALTRMGWKVAIIWECETKRPETLMRKIHALFPQPNKNS